MLFLGELILQQSNYKLQEVVFEPQHP